MSAVKVPVCFEIYDVTKMNCRRNIADEFHISIQEPVTDTHIYRLNHSHKSADGVTLDLPMQMMSTEIAMNVFVDGQPIKDPLDKDDSNICSVQPLACLLISPHEWQSPHGVNKRMDWLDGNGTFCVHARALAPVNIASPDLVPSFAQLFTPSIEDRLSDAHNTLQRLSSERASQTAQAVLELSQIPYGDESSALRERIVGQFFRVPAPDMGCKQVKFDTKEEMLHAPALTPEALYCDWTQMTCMNRIQAQRNSLVHYSSLCSAIMRATTNLYQASDPGSMLPQSHEKSSEILSTFANNLLQTTNGCALMHDQIFECLSQQCACSAVYTSDSKVNSINTKKQFENGVLKTQTAVSASPDGESQLSAGLPYSINSLVQQRFDIASGKRKHYAKQDVSATKVGEDCEDFSFHAAACLNVLSHSTRSGVLVHVKEIIKHNPRIQAYSALLTNVGQTLCQGDSALPRDSTVLFAPAHAKLAPSKSLKTYASTLGLATGASSGQGQGSTYLPVTREEHDACWQQGLQNGMLCGHSFMMSCAPKVVKKFPSGAEAVMFEDAKMGEQTALTRDVSEAQDADGFVKCSFQTRKPELMQQLNGLQNSIMFRSSAMSMRNGFVAQFVSKDKGVPCVGTQLRNDNNPTGFLQHLIAMGEHTIFSCDRPVGSCANNIITPVASTIDIKASSQRIPTVAVSVPIADEEAQILHNLITLCQPSVSNAVKPNTVLTPHECQTFGKMSNISVVTRVRAGNKGDVGKAARDVVKKIGGVGGSVIDKNTMIVYLEQIQ